MWSGGAFDVAVGTKIGVGGWLVLSVLLLGARLNAEPTDPGVSTLKGLSLEELMDIQVTSVGKRPERLLEAASAIQVITGEEMRRSGASSIPETLRLADNLDVAQKNAHDWAISARGFNTSLANKLLVLLDGRAVYTPLFSGVSWDRQDYLLADLDRIEVVSGPGGTLWGANAVNGVINIISRKAQETQGLYLEAGGGLELNGFAGIRYGGKLAPNVYYRVYGKFANRDDGAFEDGSRASNGWDSLQGGFRLDATTSAGQFTFQGDIYRHRESLSTGGDARVGGGNLLARWTRQLGGGAEWTLQIYYDRTQQSLAVPALVLNGTQFAPAGTLRDSLDTYDLDFQHRFQLGERHALIWGFGYRFTQNVLTNAPALGFLPRVLGRNLFNAFIQDEIRLLPNLTFTLGTKVEHNDYTGFEFEPSARLQWNVTPNQTVWAAVSRAVRAPSRVDREIVLPAPPFFTVQRGGPDFASETVVAYELGYRARFGSRVNFSLSGFYNVYDRLRSTSITPATILPFFFANNLEGETYGFEASATFQVLDGWKLRFGYRLLQEHLRVKPGQFDLNAGRNETADPQQQFTLRSSIDLPRNVELDVALRWVDRLFINNADVVRTVPSYFELDARLAWRISQRWEVSLIGRNLLHRRHVEYGFPSATREAVERGLHGKLTWRY